MQRNMENGAIGPVVLLQRLNFKQQWLLVPAELPECHHHFRHPMEACVVSSPWEAMDRGQP